MKAPPRRSRGGALFIGPLAGWRCRCDGGVETIDVARGVSVVGVGHVAARGDGQQRWHAAKLQPLHGLPKLLEEAALRIRNAAERQAQALECGRKGLSAVWSKNEDGDAAVREVRSPMRQLSELTAAIRSGEAAQ